MKHVPLLALNLALAVCACGDAGDQHDSAFEGSDGIEPVRAQEDVLAEINVGSQTVKFLQLGEGAEAALILTTSGNIDEGNVVDSLRAGAGDLTLLEIFQALAPADQKPPPALVHAHADEVIALGRDGDQIRFVEKALTPPPGVSSCADSLHRSCGTQRSGRHLAEVPATYVLVPRLKSATDIRLRPPARTIRRAGNA